MENAIYAILNKLEGDDRSTLLYMISKKADDSNSDESALYFGGESNLFITIEDEVVGVKSKGKITPFP